MADDLDTIRDAYLDNADYDVDGSVAEAKAFRTACRRLIVMLPTTASRGGSAGSQQVGFRLEEVRRSLQEVDAWLSQNDGDSYPVTHPDFSNSRGDL